jgi:hypothetical protein
MDIERSRENRALDKNACRTGIEGYPGRGAPLEAGVITVLAAVKTRETTRGLAGSTVASRLGTTMTVALMVSMPP